jgi:hypothetical protein
MMDRESSMKRIASGIGKLGGVEYPINSEFTLSQLEDGTMELYCKFSLTDQKHVPYSKKISNITGYPFKRFEGTSRDGKPISIEYLQLKKSNSSHEIHYLWFLAEKISL